MLGKAWDASLAVQEGLKLQVAWTAASDLQWVTLFTYGAGILSVGQCYTSRILGFLLCSTPPPPPRGSTRVTRTDCPPHACSCPQVGYHLPDRQHHAL